MLCELTKRHKIILSP